ncbi:hypothetical protein HHK36_010903 [Tetracentron sinense]|uniref:Malectin-like domain-containing protein n=1 Tax=Tetracentron sinense TaxID=13715 RepID=A0A835DJE7_TETSI|nr:hypothetical protein HHK36_010903 [Tetracentron sinense]
MVYKLESCRSYVCDETYTTGQLSGGLMRSNVKRISLPCIDGVRRINSPGIVEIIKNSADGAAVITAMSELPQVIDTTGWVMIDCGAKMSYIDGNGIRWKTDDEFIEAGENRIVSNNEAGVPQQMESLRSFTKKSKNCYSLPTTKDVRYLIRAGFYYGNYDGLNRPPLFHLVIDRDDWSTVDFLIDRPVYNEVIYTGNGNNASVCLSQIGNDVPFISSLEALPLLEDMYSGMTRDFMWFKSYRFHFGGSDVIRYPDDKYNRVWDPLNVSDVIAVTANFTNLTSTTVDYPPELAFLKAIEAPKSTYPISLWFEFSTSSNRFNYVSLYYTEVSELQPNETRSFSIYVDGEDLGFTIKPRYRFGEGVRTTTRLLGNMNVVLYPMEGSTLPPIISAIEIYTASPPLATTGTTQDDLDGLEILMKAFKQLQGWTGDPCLPMYTQWDWVYCNYYDLDGPSRVTQLLLSGYGLDGPLPQFDQMQALEFIDLSNNSLDGKIPSFLGKLPNIRTLDLSHNNFSGHVPRSVTNRSKKMNYNVIGNPLLHPRGINKALIIGLAIGVILVVVIVYCFYRRKQRARTAVIATELVYIGKETQAWPPRGNVTINVSSKEVTKPLPQGEEIPVSVDAGELTQPSTRPSNLLRHEGVGEANGDGKAGPASNTTGWVMIDCGAETSYIDQNGIRWRADEEFIQAGENRIVNSSNEAVVPQQMESLRIFTQKSRNCYSLPTIKDVRYLIRAGFYYGNYDGHHWPPEMILVIDRDEWGAVITRIDGLVYKEIIYTSIGNNVSVCLSQLLDYVPFISSLEALPLLEDMYSGMTRNLMWFNSYRFHFGGTDVIRYPEDRYNRLWNPLNVSNTIVVTGDFSNLTSTAIDYPPESAFLKAIEAPKSTSPISLRFKFDTSNRFNYVSLYYSEVLVLQPNETRSFSIHVDGKDLGFTIRPRYRIGEGVRTTTSLSGNMNIVLYPMKGSTLPPIISAIEIYTASPQLATTGTHKDDLDGLAILMRTFKQLQGWTGDPCLPMYSTWDWLYCSYFDIDSPRVISLALSGHGLDGPLPKFKQMKALAFIDLSNNSLDGKIPSFLGKLPDIRTLVTGNPLLLPRGSNKALIIGLATGIPVGFVLLLILVYYFYWKKQEARTAVTATEVVYTGREAQARPPGDNVTINVSSE